MLGYKDDELPNDEYGPAMSYISLTEPGTIRGPHEHVDQADNFCFIGPGNFKLMLWDNRPDSPTYWTKQVIFTGQDNPMSVIIPKGVVHAYECITSCMGAVINLPNRLFAGELKKEGIDEVRHEADPNSPFQP